LFTSLPPSMVAPSPYSSIHHFFSQSSEEEVGEKKNTFMLYPPALYNSTFLPNWCYKYYRCDCPSTLEPDQVRSQRGKALLLVFPSSSSSQQPPAAVSIRRRSVYRRINGLLIPRIVEPSSRGNCMDMMGQVQGRREDQHGEEYE